MTVLSIKPSPPLIRTSVYFVSYKYYRSHKRIFAENKAIIGVRQASGSASGRGTHASGSKKAQVEARIGRKRNALTKWFSHNM